MSYARTNPAQNVRASRPANHRPTGASAPGTGTAEPSRELQHHGAYAVKAPDPAKRDKIKKVADAETQSYEQYKQNKKPNVQYVTTNASVGASSGRQPNPFERLSNQGTRPRVSSNTGGIPGAPKLKPPSLRSQSLRMEDPEIERRKVVQRQKAEALQSKQHDRQAKLDDDRRRKNCQFLDRLEGKR